MSPSEAVERLTASGFVAGLGAADGSRILAGTGKVTVPGTTTCVFENAFVIRQQEEGWMVSKAEDSGEMSHSAFPSLEEAVAYVCRRGSSGRA
jgi:hypothetical protein